MLNWFIFLSYITQRFKNFGGFFWVKRKKTGKPANAGDTIADEMDKHGN